MDGTIEARVEASEPIQVSDLRPYHVVAIETTDTASYGFRPKVEDGDYLKGPLDCFSEEIGIRGTNRVGRERLPSHMARISKEAIIADGSPVTFSIYMGDSIWEPLELYVASVRRHENDMLKLALESTLDECGKTGQAGKTLGILVVGDEMSGDIVVQTARTGLDILSRQRAAQVLMKAALLCLEESPGQGPNIITFSS